MTSQDPQPGLNSPLPPHDPGQGYGAPMNMPGGHPGGAYPPPMAPYGMYDPATGAPLSDKSKVAAGVLNILIPGVGRMYAGYVGLGVGQLVVAVVTFGVGALWGWIDGIVMLCGQPRDKNGLLMR